MENPEGFLSGINPSKISSSDGTKKIHHPLYRKMRRQVTSNYRNLYFDNPY
jgi:hypothetical protein